MRNLILGSVYLMLVSLVVSLPSVAFACGGPEGKYEPTKAPYTNADVDRFVGDFGMHSGGWSSGTGWTVRKQQGHHQSPIHRTMLAMHILDKGPGGLRKYNFTEGKIDDLDGFCRKTDNAATADGFSSVNLYWSFYYNSSPLVRASTLIHEARHNESKRCNGDWYLVSCTHDKCTKGDNKGSYRCDEKYGKDRSPYTMQFNFLLEAMRRGVQDVQSRYVPGGLSHRLGFLVSPEHVREVAQRAKRIITSNFNRKYNYATYGISDTIEFAQGVHAADGTEFEGPTLPAGSETCGRFFFDLGPAQFRVCSDYWRSNGMAISLLSAIYRNGKPSYAGIADSGSWVEPALVLRESDFRARVQQENLKGYAPTQISVISGAFGEPPLFTAAFARIPGELARVETDVMRSDVLRWTTNGWVLADLFRYSDEKGAERFAIVSIRNPTRAEIGGAPFFDLSREQFDRRVKEGSRALLVQSVWTEAPGRLYGIFPTHRAPYRDQLVFVDADAIQGAMARKHKEGLEAVRLHVAWNYGAEEPVYSVTFLERCPRNRVSCPFGYRLEAPAGSVIVSSAACVKVIPAMSECPDSWRGPESVLVDYSGNVDKCYYQNFEKFKMGYADTVCPTVEGAFEVSVNRVPGPDTCSVRVRPVCSEPVKPVFQHMELKMPIMAIYRD